MIKYGRKITEELFWLYCEGIRSLMVGEVGDGSRYIVSSQEAEENQTRLLSYFSLSLLFSGTPWNGAACNLTLAKIFGIPTQTRLMCLLSDLKFSQGDNED